MYSAQVSLPVGYAWRVRKDVTVNIDNDTKQVFLSAYCSNSFEITVNLPNKDVLIVHSVLKK